MHLIHPGLYSRRAFLRRSAQLAFTGAALPTALNLAAMGEAAAFNAGSSAADYKALVCVFLFGGNDYANTVVPYDVTHHQLYTQARTDIALSRASLAATRLTSSTGLPPGFEYALHPNMTGLAGLFNAGQAAVQLNVGPLVEPLTRAQYEAESRRQPPKLFSHNDQQSYWQSSSPEGSTVGWGGQLGDLALSSNTGNSLFTCVSVTGNAVFLSGDRALSYQVSPGGAVRISAVDGWSFGSMDVGTTLGEIVQAQSARGHVLENMYNGVTRRAITAEKSITAALQAYPDDQDHLDFAAIPNTNLGRQLRMVARLIAARNQLGTRRQVFFVSMGGFDTHSGLIGGHGALMQELSDALTGFHQVTGNANVMGAGGLADQVTAFTASEFGRTLTSNGDGSDHGWGSHHLMVGGAVQGGVFYGKAPPVSAGDSDNAEDQWHVGQGRLLPSTSVDQYAGTLARWFGVNNSELAGILPNLANFSAGNGYPPDLGFMAA
jgi:uncharacterized protein (DUF1501 family)